MSCVSESVLSPSVARLLILIFHRSGHHHHHLFAQNTIEFDSGYVNEQDRKAHCALTSVHNITLSVERNTHSTIHGIGVTRNR